MSFKLQILGSNSSLPAYGRHHTSQYLNIENNHFLIDCGEGAQYQILKYKVKSHKIDTIFVSHLHGDHYLGLMGILFSQHLSGRENELVIFGQKGLDEIITVQLKHSGSVLNYPIRFETLNVDQKEVIFETHDVTVESIPLIHRVPCTGFLFKEKEKERRIIGDKIPDHFPVEYFDYLKHGKDIVDTNGDIIYKNSEYTLPPKKSRSYAFCSDTGYDEKLAEKVTEVDLLYHEATFLEEKKKWARQTFHSTTHDAAKVAKAANVGKLLIGHFSARYKDIQPFVNECKEIFPETYAAIEGETITVDEE